MPTPSLDDLTDVEVEHLLGMASGAGLVKLRAIGRNAVLIGQLHPATARQLALDLLAAAARAEYEQDLATGARNRGIPDDAVGLILQTVREGEARRMTTTPENEQ
jgi:hypothetical protein